MAEYIEREDAYNVLTEYYHHSTEVQHEALREAIERVPAADVQHVPEGGIGEMSDGYHTFNGLYYQRMMLFAMLVKAYKSSAWKTKCHEDGEPCFGGGWFLVTIDTPNGAYGYHYEDKYWDLFDCEELPKAKHWDGYTEEDITRLLSLPDVQLVVHGKWIERNPQNSKICRLIECSECGEGAVVNINIPYDEWVSSRFRKYCGCCGAYMWGGE